MDVALKPSIKERQSMKQGTYSISANVEIASGIFRMRLEGDTSAFLRGGQFVDIAVPGLFLRRPLAVREWDDKGFDVVYKVVGEGTAILSGLKEGERLEVLTGLGNGFDARACRSSALVVCGGLGASPAFSLVKELLRTGRKVTVILGFNRATEVVLFKEYQALGADVHLVTVDGSAGLKGFVTDAVNLLSPEYDYFYTCGPKVMMKALCGQLEGPGEVSLEERMGCGCGICYGCTCHTVSGPKRVCADGPVFKKEEVIW